MAEAAKPGAAPGATGLPERRSAMGAIGVDAAFWAYRRMVSPMLHAVGWTHCKYLPTCSEYGYVAMARFGVWRGGWMALRRVMRCHPWAKGGLDPVPDK